MNSLLLSLKMFAKGLLSLSLLYHSCRYTSKTGMLTQPLKNTQSLKSKYIMPIAVMNVGVVAVQAFMLKTDSYSCPLTECIYSKPPLTLWIPGIDFLNLKPYELYWEKEMSPLIWRGFFSSVADINNFAFPCIIEGFMISLMDRDGFTQRHHDGW